MHRACSVLATGLLALTACTTAVTGTPGPVAPVGTHLSAVLSSLDLANVVPNARIVGTDAGLRVGRVAAVLPDGAVAVLLDVSGGSSESRLVTLSEHAGDLGLTGSWSLPVVSHWSQVSSAADGTVVVAGAVSAEQGDEFQLIVLTPGVDEPRIVRPTDPLLDADYFTTALSADGSMLYAAYSWYDDRAPRLLAIDVATGAVAERGLQVDAPSGALVSTLTARPDRGVDAAVALVAPGPDKNGRALLVSYDAHFRRIAPPVDLASGRPGFPWSITSSTGGTTVVLLVDDVYGSATPRLLSVRDGVVVRTVDMGEDGADPPIGLTVDPALQLAHAATPSSAGPTRVRTIDLSSGATLADVSPCADAERFGVLAASPRTGRVLAVGTCAGRLTAVLLGS